MLIQDFKNSKGEWARSLYIDGVKVKTVSGEKWGSLVSRCKPGGPSQVRCPTYVGTSNGFKDFHSFADWCIQQVGYNRGWSLDKDIVFKGNKIYSEDTCVFVPNEVNAFLTKHNSARGIHPLGVCWSRFHLKYVSSCSDGFGKSKHLGYFECPSAAFNAYKVYKENIARVIAERWQGQVDERVVLALNSYIVEISD